VRINPLPPQLPAPLRPKPIIVRVPAPPDATLPPTTPGTTTMPGTTRATTVTPPAQQTTAGTRKHGRGAGR
jgi:hypothetical protein